MILFTAKMVKLLLLVFVWMSGLHLFKSRLPKKQLIYLGILVTMFAFGANYVSNLLPPLTDTVKLTALGEKFDEAKGVEVYLNGYTIDGEEFVAGKSLKIESGHWFWSGETYAWRPETDTRKPDGITREVVLKIPVGWKRTLNFRSNVWRGLVEIDNGSDIWIEDTYVEDTVIKSVQIGKSHTLDLILNQLQYLLLYTFILLILSMCVAWIITRALCNPDKAKEWLGKNDGKLIYVGIAFVTFILMFHYADKFSLWRDELGQITFTKGIIKNSILFCLNMENCNPPLELLFHNLWYHIAPYGEQWLLLPSIILSCASVFLLGLIGERIHGKYCGILSCILLAFSTTLWTNGAYEYRSYAFFIFFSVLTLYSYIRRNNSNSKGENILFSLSLLGNAMIHYFGMLAMAGYFLADVYLILRKQIKIKNILVYFPPGIVSIIWLLIVRMVSGDTMTSNVSWQSIPTFMHILGLFKFLSGDIEILYWLFCAGIGFACSYLFVKGSKNFNWKRFNIIFLFLFLLGCISLIFVYGNFINQNSTMWAERYFIFLLPNVVLLSAFALSKTVCLLINKLEYQVFAYRSICFFIGMVVILNCMGLFSSSTSLSLSALGKADTRTSEPYREAADWLYEQSNYIFNEDTLILVNHSSNVISGWQEYYITRQGRRDALNIVLQKHINNYEDVLQYNRIYLQYIKAGPAASLQKILNENYKLETDNKNVKVRVYVRK